MNKFIICTLDLQAWKLWLYAFQNLQFAVNFILIKIYQENKKFFKQKLKILVSSKNSSVVRI